MATALSVQAQALEERQATHQPSLPRKRLALTGWARSRRVVVLLRPIKGEIVLAGEDNGQQLLGFIEADWRTAKQITVFEYAVLVTNTDYEILSLGKLYRDRADAENAFDELKNQWG
jgi:hypothetical protein